ncbi:TPA: molecular chaperone [Escherichia coli]|uniref:Fimbria/pilus periplasmic chaperone n=2 Tax=Enterobacteriaceae TaxID=543 RepID=A0A8S7N1M4_ECOLX|nr:MULTISPECIES: fimbria/pilus periplasmic chaperone [Enterobacteriaceae]EIY3990367.1 fimbria/pilus periplasmic chaperone [Salmonella enterica]EAC1938365.1 molecular chaperone [Escherichia coli]EEW1774289.1 molecular chaperone [Escherichia coli]EEW2108899.1 molecular chaperone [Escherichia coli]EEW2232990.1 molecular chaperone [Escherichia coli]
MLKNKLAVKKTLMAVACLSIVQTVQAAISLDRTRAIFNGNEKNMTLNISNDNKQLPYLAQAWIENDKHEKILTGPIIATPPVQRLEPGEKSMIRLSSTPGIMDLPQDRESIFYFNLREIPPKSEKQNVLQIALQTKIKLFYRPASITPKPNEAWQDKLILNKIPGGYRIENPTPYYITIIGIGGDVREAKEGKFDVIMISPKSEEYVHSRGYNTPYVNYIDDYGGRPVLKFICNSTRCLSKGEKY